MLCIIMELEIIPNLILVFKMRRSERVNTINIRRFAHLRLPEPVFLTGVYIFTGYPVEVIAREIWN